MSAVLALVQPRARLSDGEACALRTFAVRHGGDIASWQDPAGHVLLAAARGDRDEDDAGSLAVSGAVVVAADASLYYRRDLARAIRAAGGEARADDSAAALVAAAYHVWGAACLARLEGDFAAVVWDGHARALQLTRDFSGARPLFHAVARGGAIGVASGMDVLLAMPDVDASLDRDVLAQSSSWIFSADPRTVRRGVQRVQPGAIVTLDVDSGRVRTETRWQPPVFEREAAGGSFDDAADRLRDLLADAVRERASTAGTAVWMSGGYDSTAVFAAGQHAGASHIMPVSVSYPPGDIGREDEAIELVAERWGADVRWLRSADVDLFARLEDTMARAHEPFVHLYAEFNAALARTTAGAGARVALGGYGGDQLFWASRVYLADLLRSGHLRTLWGEARRTGLDAAGAFDWIVKPLLPSPLLGAARRLGGGERWLRPLERAVPAWVAAETVRDAALQGAFHRAHPRRRGESLSAYDTYYMLANPFFGRVLEAVSGITRAHGVEYRSPMLDRRVVEFAATRPRRERTSGGASKLLLRRAMRGLLPPSVLAPRPYKTGTTRDLFAASARRWMPALLGDLGVLDVDAFRRACGDFQASGDMLLAGALMPTLQTELWLRAHERRTAGGGGASRIGQRDHTTRDRVALT